MSYTKTSILQKPWRMENLLTGATHILNTRKDVCLRTAVGCSGNHLLNGLKLLGTWKTELRVIGFHAVELPSLHVTMGVHDG